MDELAAGLKKGAYRIPKHVNLTVECLDFLDSCLRFDSIKRKDWDSLLQHSFLTGELGGLTGFGNANESVVMNARQSCNLFEVYQKQLVQNIEARIRQQKQGAAQRHQQIQQRSKQRAPPNPESASLYQEQQPAHRRRISLNANQGHHCPKSAHPLSKQRTNLSPIQGKANNLYRDNDHIHPPQIKNWNDW